jgi:hypothetical protein
MMSGEGDVAAARQRDTDAAVVCDIRFRDARNAGTVSVLIDNLGRKPDDSRLAPGCIDELLKQGREETIVTDAGMLMVGYNLTRVMNIVGTKTLMAAIVA